MCRNHRGFIEALLAANRIGANALLLNTSFAGPALAEVAEREGADVVIYDEEFSETVERALSGLPDAVRIIAWTDEPGGGAETTVDALIEAHRGERPGPPNAAARSSC